MTTAPQERWETSVERAQGKCALVIPGKSAGTLLNKNEDRMLATFARIRILAIAAVFSIGAGVTGCSDYKVDDGAKRTQQQSEELDNRIMTTQIDR